MKLHRHRRWGTEPEGLGDFGKEVKDMTGAEAARLVAWLKKEGYTLDEVVAAIQYIAFGTKDC